MKKIFFRKGLVVVILTLFLGATIVSAINSNVEPANVINKIGYLNRDTYTFYPTDDASIKEALPQSNFAADGLVVRNKYGGYGSPGFEDDILIKFDTSELSPGVEILSATLNLFYNEWTQNNPRGRTLTLYRIINDWDENTVTWDTRPSHDSGITSSAVVPSTTDLWMMWDVTSNVQDFVEGQENNYGWQIMDEVFWGDFDIPATWFLQKEHGSNTAYLEVEIETTSNPPNKPTIDGPASGKMGVSYVYTANTTDPDGDQIYYLFDWGDETNSGWGDPYNSGVTAYESHIWTLQGTFIVKVKASDIHGAESEWSDPLLVTMPRTISFNSLLLKFLERFPNAFQILRYLITLQT